MEIEDLTPAEREEVQLHFLRVYLAKKRRQRYDEQMARKPQGYPRQSRYAPWLRIKSN